jgi:hypothetical protein
VYEPNVIFFLTLKPIDQTALNGYAFFYFSALLKHPHKHTYTLTHIRKHLLDIKRERSRNVGRQIKKTKTHSGPVTQLFSARYINTPVVIGTTEILKISEKNKKRTCF